MDGCLNVCKLGSGLPHMLSTAAMDSTVAAVMLVAVFAVVVAFMLSVLSVCSSLCT